MGITYGDHLIDSGYHNITPEQEREIWAREECARRGIDPDDNVADGVDAWMVVAQEPGPPSFECEDCIGMKQHGCYCAAMGASGPGVSPLEPLAKIQNWYATKGHPEDNWTEEQHAAAEATGKASLEKRIALLGQGSCNCNTKSPDVHMHLPTCRYRQAMELADEVESAVETTNNERDVLAYKLDQAVNTAQPMLIARAERAEGAVSNLRRKLEDARDRFNLIRRAIYADDMALLAKQGAIDATTALGSPDDAQASA